MAYDGQTRTASGRLAVLGLAFLAGHVFLALALRQVQVARSASFTRDQLRQSLRRVQIPAPRGRIFDRKGILLADNRPSYCIAYYVEELRRRGPWENTIQAVDADIDRLAAVLELPRQISREQIRRHVLRSLPMPLLAWRDVSQETLARWAESLEEFPGVDIFVQPERHYPLGSLAAHVLGYVGRDRPQPLPGERVHFYLPKMVGRDGVERQYNEHLTGVPGGQLIRVDARGYKHAVWAGATATPGQDLHLTLDARVQMALEAALHGWRGAGVALDPRNGEVLALASSPTFDPNEFIPFIRSAAWTRMTEDSGQPLFNRAVAGRYAPGSTFKPVTAIAALIHGGLDVETPYFCDGAFVLGAMRIRCWNIHGHGQIMLRKALEQSCNSYFCHAAHMMGYDAIYAESAKLGLGRLTGIDLPGESAGLLPTMAWKERTHKDRWRPGDTSQISIGQGFLVTTPLQMALLTAVFANRGTLHRPHLTRHAAVGAPTREMGWPLKSVNAVRDGMLDATVYGTGRRVLMSNVAVASKTGTAEVDVGGERRKNTWMIAFAPFDEPTLAVAIIAEQGESGGLTVAPMVRRVMISMFGESEADRNARLTGAQPAVEGD